MDQPCRSLRHFLTDQLSRRSCSQLIDTYVRFTVIARRNGKKLTLVVITFTPHRTSDAVGAPLLQTFAVVAPLPERASTWLVRAYTTFAARWTLRCRRFLWGTLDSAESAHHNGELLTLAGSPLGCCGASSSSISSASASASSSSSMFLLSLASFSWWFA
jgi:hypothetical protein